MREMRTFLLLSVVALVACGGPSFEDLCERYGDECNVSESEVESCKASAAFIEERIDGTGCEDEFDAWLACIDGVSDLCDEAQLEAQCEGASEAVNECVDPN